MSNIEDLKKSAVAAIAAVVRDALKDLEAENKALRAIVEDQAGFAADQRDHTDITVSLSSQEVTMLARMLGLASQQGHDEDRATASILYCRIVNESNRRSRVTAECDE